MGEQQGWIYWYPPNPNLYAMMKQKVDEAHDFETQYAHIVAVERYDTDDGEPHIRYWLPGRPPVPSDRLEERGVSSWFINWVDILSPQRRTELVRAGHTFGWNWA
jgi:hypothetical protein